MLLSLTVIIMKHKFYKGVTDNCGKSNYTVAENVNLFKRKM